MSKQSALDPQTLALVRFAAAIAQGYEPELRAHAQGCKTAQVPVAWVEELLLQSLLMVGYPRTLIAFTMWRKVSKLPAPPGDPDAGYQHVSDWTRRGEETCRVVYGTNYERLRENVKQLHPALDTWMITEGYGRTMSRPGLDLLRRELCTVAQTAVLEAPRQLHSHLRGSLHAGGSFEQVEAVLSVVNPLLSYEEWKKVKELWQTVKDAWDPEQ
jgi:4-carboxymuconolactone decarboxylase